MLKECNYTNIKWDRCYGLWYIYVININIIVTQELLK